MNRISRRQLARYGAQQLLAGTPAKKLARQLAAVLADNRRGADAELLVNDIAWELESSGHFANAQVTTARRLDAAYRAKLIKLIKEAAAVSSVEIEEHLEPAVLGGIRVETAAHSWDETIARRLDQLKGTA